MRGLRTHMGRSTARTALAAAFVAVVLAGSASPVSTSFWRVATFGAMKAGSFDGTSLTHDGRVVLAPEVEPAGVPEVRYVWGGVWGNDGALVVTTGTPGVVYALGGAEPRVLLADETADFPAMAASPSGDVYVGSAPGGAVYRIRPDGSNELFFESGEDYVWSMAYSDEHGLLVGTGDLARVYAVGADGTGSLIYDSDDTSITALAAFDGMVLAGTGLDGLLLDVTPGRDLRVLYDTSFDEITGITRRPDGTVCFSASTVLLDDVILDPSRQNGGLGEGSVYRTTEAGGAAELWHSPDSPVTALGLMPDGALLAGTASGGLVYRIDPDGGTGVLLELPGEEVLAIGGGERVVVATGLPGGAHVIGAGVSSRGEYLSDVLDSRSTSTWGRLSARADVPPGSGIEFQSRSGNTEVPGDTWSEWSAAGGAGGGQVTSPGARFLQWRASLERGSGGATPSLRDVEVAYLRENLAPIVGAVTVFEPGDVVTGSAAGGNGSAVTQSLPGGVELTYSVDAPGASRGVLPELIRGMRTASWEALDPNGDALSFELLIRAEDESEWRTLADQVMWRTLHTWDTRSLPDGSYEIRVVASDRPDNPADLALEDSRTGPVFVVDNTPPVIARIEVSDGDGRAVVAGEVTDSASAVSAVDVAVDYGEWMPAFAADGMFDSREESFALEIEDPGPGEHTVAVRAFDRAGNPVVERKLLR